MPPKSLQNWGLCGDNGGYRFHPILSKTGRPLIHHEELQESASMLTQSAKSSRPGNEFSYSS